jgi:hypothetical protein
VSVGARQPDTVRTEFTAPAGTAPQELAVLLPMKVDGAERGRGQCREHARVLRDRARDAFAAGQPGADHLVGVSAIVLSARRALGGAASLAGDRQGAAGLVDGGVAMEQFAGSPVEMVDAAAQQNRLQAATRIPGGACGGIGGQEWSSSRRCPYGRDGTSGGKPAARLRSLWVRRSAVRCRIWPRVRLPAAQANGECGVGTVSGHPV